MQTNLTDHFKHSPDGIIADDILRKCVHCGFCSATCPTYQLSGDELESPRGRIYQIKQMLEGEPVTQITQTHLDNCLTCLNCETTCPSGVNYGKLADIGKQMLEEKVPRARHQQLIRWLIRQCLPFKTRFALLLGFGTLLKPLLPHSLKNQLPKNTGRKRISKAPPPQINAAQTRIMLLLDGCVQPALTPKTNLVAQRLFNHLRIELVSPAAAGCCGAISYHMQASEEGKAFARKNIDAWWPLVEQGAEAIVISASGCGAFVKEYADILAADKIYAEKAARISSLTRDISEVLINEDLSTLTIVPRSQKIAFHSPCSLQHAQKLGGTIESLLEKLGFQLQPFNESHLCCGSAGTYSLLKPQKALALRDRKLTHINKNQPDLIATANVGCQHHLQSGSESPVIHWIELLDPLNNTP